MIIVILEVSLWLLDPDKMATHFRLLAISFNPATEYLRNGAVVGSEYLMQ